MSTCQVDSWSCRQTLSMRANIGLCIRCNHSVNVHSSLDNDDIEIIQNWNSK